MAKQTRAQKEEQDRTKRELAKMLPPGSVVWCVLRHVSSSGMSRDIDLYTIKHNEPCYLSGYACAAMGWARAKSGAIKVGGCGMDMGFHIVQNLSYAIHGMQSKGDGALPENAGRPFTPTRKSYRSGYSLIHRWL